VLRKASLIAAALVLLVFAGISVLYALQPNSYRLTRSRTIAASASAIRPCLVDFKLMEGWQTQIAAPHDPPTVTFSPVTSGVGAWRERKDSIGSGRTELVEITESSVRLRHVNQGRFGSITSTVDFLLRERGTSTEVEYVIAAPISGLPRLLWPIADLENRIGPDMVKALEQLEAKCAAARALE